MKLDSGVAGMTIRFEPGSLAGSRAVGVRRRRHCFGAFRRGTGLLIPWPRSPLAHRSAVALLLPVASIGLLCLRPRRPPQKLRLRPVPAVGLILDARLSRLVAAVVPRPVELLARPVIRPPALWSLLIVGRLMHRR